jgi:hypothetical protein
MYLDGHNSRKAASEKVRTKMASVLEMAHNKQSSLKYIWQNPIYRRRQNNKLE